MGQFDVEGFGDRLEGVLGGRVVAVERLRDVPGHGGDVDDHTGAPLPHAGDEGLHQAHRSEDIGLEHEADVLDVEILYRAVEGDGGIVHESIDPAELSAQPLDRGVVGDVQPQPRRHIDVAEDRDVSGGGDDLVPAARQEGGGGPADTGAGARDKDPHRPTLPGRPRAGLPGRGRNVYPELTVTESAGHLRFTWSPYCHSENGLREARFRVGATRRGPGEKSGQTTMCGNARRKTLI